MRNDDIPEIKLMKKILVYSHDTYGLGNIRRMLAVVEHLVASDPDVCALILSGSPMMHAFRLSPRIDYIKLPCLQREESGNYSAKYLDISYRSIISLRADLILNTILNFEPDLILVDKKPLGVQNELAPAFDVLRRKANRPKLVLILREILDAPEQTKSIWERNGYHDTIREMYDTVLVLGPKDVFDTAAEYAFPPTTTALMHHCGYVAKRNPRRLPDKVRLELGAGDAPIVLLTAGGGKDGYPLLKTGIDALAPVCAKSDMRVLLVPGPEMEADDRNKLHAMAEEHTHVTSIDFTNDMLSYLQAADVVVSMAGYNTVTELLSLGKPALLVPRTTPSLEQWIRATRLERLGRFAVIHPDQLSAASMRQAVLDLLNRKSCYSNNATPSMDGLLVVEKHVRHLLGERETKGWMKLQQLHERPPGVDTITGEQSVDVLTLPLATAQQ